MAGQMTENVVLGFLDYCTAYISVLLGRCVLISVFVFAVILLMRCVFFRNTIFPKGMLWGLLLITPFLGKVRILHEMDSLGGFFVYWDILCCERLVVRLGYVFGIVLCAGGIYCRRRRLNRVIRRMEQEEICGQQVYINELPVTPFATGLIHPRIVIPRIMKENFQTEELQIILLHERTHIHAGHLWFYAIWNMLWVILWPNLMFIVCRPLFQEDLEDICDRITMKKSGGGSERYGRILLKSMRILDFGKAGAFVTFAGEREYRSVRQRFLRIAGFKLYGDRWIKSLCMAGVAVLTGIILLALQNSYPRYIEVKDVVLADASGEILTILQDGSQLREAVSWDESRVYINRKSMDQLLWKQGIEFEEDHFQLVIVGDTKIPGMGDGGSIVDVDYSGQSPEICIPYYNREHNLTAEIFKRMP